MGTTPIYGFPYPDPSDLVANYPALGQQLAEDVETAIVGASKVVQVISTAKTDTFSMTSSTYATVTGLTATITPADNTNKILIMAQIATAAGNAATMGNFKVTRGGTDIYIGASTGNRIPAVFGGYLDSNLAAVIISHSIIFLDSPATTSAVTYQVETRNNSGASPVYVNRASGDSNNENFARGASSITVMEISA